MKKYVTLTFAALALLVLSACKSKQQQPEQEPVKRAIVLYYSQTGATRSVAEAIAEAVDADIEEIIPEVPYDADYDATIARCKQERDEGVLPALKPLNADLSRYDTIFLGYPVWFGTYALPVGTFVSEAELGGKVIVPFCTFGSGGLENTEADLRQALPDSRVAPGYGVRNARLAAMPRELNRFLIEQGYIAGEVTPLPEYSEQGPVSQDEQAIFDAACSGYKFPLGTPTSVGSRTTDEGTDYRFTVSSTTPDGQSAVATIYVTVSNDSVGTTEFTKVVR
jgi:flavodoxin